MNFAITFLKRLKAKLLSVVKKGIFFLFSKFPLKQRIFFYSIRSNDILMENCKCIYEAVQGQKVVFCRMLPHSNKSLPKIYYYLLTSKVIVTDDYLKYLREITLRPEQKVVQLWHAGGAFKKFGLDAPSRLSAEQEKATHSQYSCVCVTSESVRPFYAEAFGIAVDKVMALGSPRTDLLLDPAYSATIKQEVYKAHPDWIGKRIYLYLPTFRECGGVHIDFDPMLSWEKLNAQLHEDEIFVVRRHPIMKKDFFQPGIYSHIVDCTLESTQKLMTVACVIVTDYSSVVFDASLLRCPSVFYCPDFDTYERDFYLRYPQDLPGPVVYSDEALLEVIRQTACCPPEQKIKSFLEKEMSACDGHSTQRIALMIENFLHS